MDENMKNLKKELNYLKNKCVTYENKLEQKHAHVIEIETLKKEIKRQEIVNQHLEKQLRRKNIIIHGVQERVRENKSDLMRYIIDMFNSVLKLGVQPYEIEKLYRFGRFKKGKRRAIFISFVNEWRRQSVLRVASCLRRYKISIQEDYSKEILNKRRALAPIVQQLRREKLGNVELIDDRIYVNGKLWREEISQSENMYDDGGVDDNNDDDDIQIIEQPPKPADIVDIEDSKCVIEEEEAKKEEISHSKKIFDDDDDIQIIEQPPKTTDIVDINNSISILVGGEPNNANIKESMSLLEGEADNVNIKESMSLLEGEADTVNIKESMSLLEGEANNANIKESMSLLEESILLGERNAINEEISHVQIIYDEDDEDL